MNLFKSKFFKNYGFSLIILISVILGSLVGIIFKEDASVLKPFGDVFLNLMFTIVVPLVFFTVTSSIAKMLDLKRLGKIMGYSLLVFIVTCVIAALFMLISVKIVSPLDGSSVLIDTSEVTESLSIGDRIVEAITVNDFYGLLSKDNIIAIIIFSILFGIAINMAGEKANKLVEVL